MPIATAEARTGRQRLSLMDVLYIPWVDRLIAIFAVVPSCVDLYHRWLAKSLSFPRTILGVQLLVLVITMVIRRAPVRVTPNPWFWLLAFVATYSIPVFQGTTQPGLPLVPTVVSNGLAVAATAILLFARLNLGRNIGFVPAQRMIVTQGIYRLVRHPIYAGLFVALLAFVLRAYTLRNALGALTIVLLFVIKSVVEERFLSADPEYAEYMRRVRWRWFPGIA